MNIVLIAAEAYPFVKVGGLGDVVGALPPIPAQAGHDVRVIIPGYRQTCQSQTEAIEFGRELTVRMGAETILFSVRRWQNQTQPNHAVYFIDNPEYFGDRNVYCDEHGVAYPDNPARFILFQKAALKLMTEMEWQPDIIHCHDNHTALIPVYLKTTLAAEPKLQSAKSILTLHNIAYHGDCEMNLKELCDLPKNLFTPTGALEWFGRINPLKGGMIFADAVTTVSPTHAREIMSDKEISAGLNGVLSGRKTPVLGILNGIDYREWNPESDDKLFAPYSANDLSGKKVNKVELIKELKLNPALNSRPLIGLVSRLVEFKGIDLIIDSLEQILNKEAGFVLVGSGVEGYHHDLSQLAAKYPDLMAVEFGYNDPLAHKIIAGCDIFLMPSRFEPCGITQMYALHYGTVPVVHFTGGLADTVIPWDGKNGNGFAFGTYQIDSMLKAVFEAMLAYNNPTEWSRIIRNGMATDFSWERAASGYLDLYRRLQEPK